MDMDHIPSSLSRNPLKSRFECLSRDTQNQHQRKMTISMRGLAGADALPSISLMDTNSSHDGHHDPGLHFVGGNGNVSKTSRGPSLNSLPTFPSTDAVMVQSTDASASISISPSPRSAVDLFDTMLPKRKSTQSTGKTWWLKDSSSSKFSIAKFLETIQAPTEDDSGSDSIASTYLGTNSDNSSISMSCMHMHMYRPSTRTNTSIKQHVIQHNPYEDDVIEAKKDEFIEREALLDAIRRKYGKYPHVKTNINAPDAVSLATIQTADSTTVNKASTATSTTTGTSTTPISHRLYEKAIQRQERLHSKRLRAEAEERSRCKLKLVARRRCKRDDKAGQVYNRLYNSRRRNTTIDARFDDLDYAYAASSCKKTKIPKNGDCPPPLGDLERSTLVDTNSKLIESFSYLWNHGEEDLYTAIMNESPNENGVHVNVGLGAPNHSRPRPTSISTSLQTHTRTGNYSHKSMNHLINIQEQLNQDDHHGCVINSSSRYSSRLDQLVQEAYSLELSVDVVSVRGSDDDNDDEESIETLLIVQ